MGKLRELLPEKRRKDAVLAVEYVMTASPEWWQEASEWKREKFFERSLEWLEAKYGKDRVIVATVHQDWLTPHLSAFVVLHALTRIHGTGCALLASLNWRPVWI